MPFSFRYPVLRLGIGIVLVGGWLASGVTAVAQPQPKLVAETDPLSPALQQKKFHLPPGFEIQLLVAEPVIGQPMNLNFDAAGRLWVTHSIEYPFPARGDVEPRDERFQGGGENDPRDRLTVLAQIGPDGRPARNWEFIGGLNIPIGQTPVKGGAVLFSIPYIYTCRDTNGDGKADAREVLYGKFGNVDTHGLNNGFTRWIDGWIYACHGFRNTSNVKGGDGHAFSMNSGNTYRFREDGSRIEQFTWGQVNPFGLTFDPLGNLYSADCHSKPLTLLLRGAYYPSFGKPHDGLGFGPNMIDHNHGSTGICGPAYYAAEHFPAEYRGNLFLCNPVTGRVHRDRLRDVGSTRLVETQPDFITCDDPWFRPVDLQVGPDGALYVADFYNAVIGHYEVPLKHARRDRTHGRVWRVVYRGEAGKAKPPAMPDLTELPLDRLVDRLADANLVVRTLATNEIVDRFGRESLPAIRAIVGGESTPGGRAHGLWILFRLGGLDVETLRRLAGDPSRLVRTHLCRALAERAEWRLDQFEIARRLLRDGDAFVRRAAADAVGRHPHADNIRPLLAQLAQAADEDTHLKHTIRIALRNQLRSDSVVESLADVALNEDDRRQLASVAVAVPTAAAAGFLANHLQQTAEPKPTFLTYLEHVARHGSAASLERLAVVVRQQFADDVDFQYQQLEAIGTGLAQRGVKSSPAIRGWASELTLALFTTSAGNRLSWSNAPLPGNPATDDPWAIQRRVCADGQHALFFCTLPRGENATGVLRSDTFVLPAKLSFFVAGHCGFPGQPCHGKNVVRLRSAETHALLAESLPPRNDTAQKTSLKLPKQAGSRVYLELVDGDDDPRGYAWLAVGRFSFGPLNPSLVARPRAAARLVEQYRLSELEPRLRTLLADGTASSTKRAAVAEALIALKPDSRLASLIPLAASPATTAAVRERMFAAVLDREQKQIEETLALVMQSVPAGQQATIADSLAEDPRGGESLLSLVAGGTASARLLVRPNIRSKLLALKLRNGERRIAELTAKLPSRDEATAKLMADRRRSFVASSASPEIGQEIFKKSCGICHRIGSEGSLIGPQLDGVGLRGVDRLLEDLLDPNRNVDTAFRSTTIVLASGKVRTGLFRREQGATLVFADEKGQEFSIAKDDVEERARSPLSLMPADVAARLGPQEFQHLLAYLLKQRTAAQKAEK